MMFKLEEKRARIEERQMELDVQLKREECSFQSTTHANDSEARQSTSAAL